MTQSLKSVNSKMPMISFGCYVFIGLLLILAGTITSFHKNDYQNQFSFGILSTLFFINGCVGLSLLSANHFINEAVKKNILAIHIVTNSLLVGFWLFCRGSNGACAVDSKYLQIFVCNSEYNSNSLPLETLIFAMMTPFLYIFVFSNVSWKISLLSWMIIVAWIAMCIGVFSAYNVIAALLIYIAFSLMILYFIYERQRQSLLLKLESEQELKRVLEQSEKDAKEIQNTMGNVAHDLKTVNIPIIYCFETFTDECIFVHSR